MHIYLNSEQHKWIDRIIAILSTNVRIPHLSIIVDYVVQKFHGPVKLVDCDQRVGWLIGGREFNMSIKVFNN